MSSLAPPIAVAAVVLCGSAAEAGVLVPIPPVPGSTATSVTGINNANMITGFYETADGSSHGFFGSLDSHYTTFDAPAGQTFTEAINDAGYTTGGSNVPNENCPIEGCAFIRGPDGTITTILNKRRPMDGQAQGITEGVKFVGEYWYVDDQGIAEEIGLYGKRGHYRADLTLPFNTDRTRPRGYNRHGEVVGYYYQFGAYYYPGFILKDGVATAVEFPNKSAYRTILAAVNDKGKIAGGWDDVDVGIGQAFTYDLTANTFTVIDIPGSQRALARGINNDGLVTITSDVGSFLYCPKKGTCPAGGIGLKERHVAASVYSLVCEHACRGRRRVPETTPANAVALRAAIKRDPELQRELRLPFRP